MIKEGTKVPKKELEPLSKESKKAIEEDYEAIQKLTVEELKEEVNNMQNPSHRINARRRLY